MLKIEIFVLGGQIDENVQTDKNISNLGTNTFTSIRIYNSGTLFSAKDGSMNLSRRSLISPSAAHPEIMYHQVATFGERGK